MKHFKLPSGFIDLDIYYKIDEEVRDYSNPPKVEKNPIIYIKQVFLKDIEITKKLSDKVLDDLIVQIERHERNN